MYIYWHIGQPLPPDPPTPTPEPPTPTPTPTPEPPTPTPPPEPPRKKMELVFDPMYYLLVPVNLQNQTIPVSIVTDVIPLSLLSLPVDAFSRKPVPGVYKLYLSDQTLLIPAGISRMQVSVLFIPDDQSLYSVTPVFVTLMFNRFLDTHKA